MTLNPEPFQTIWERLWRWLTRWLVMAVAVWFSTAIVPGVDYVDWPSLLAAALILGILNSLVKPFLVMVAMPLVLLSLGFMLLVINAFLLVLTSKLVPGFHVGGFWPAVGASLVISLVSVILGKNRTVFRRRTKRRPDQESYSEPTRVRTPPPGKGPIIDV